MSDKERRAKRIEDVKLAMRKLILKHHPGVKPDIEIEMTPDAAIDLFGIGVLDASEEEWQEFLKGIQEAEPEPYDPGRHD